MKPWREVVVPHKDVTKGTFAQAEFAADISAVHRGTAPKEYQDAAAFFERTYITEGMRLLLGQVARRLAGQGGEPVIQLQTSFGGGKTHTMLAVLHLASRKVPLSDLPGIPRLIEHLGLLDVPAAKTAVLDGNGYSPGQPWKRGRLTIHTLWGDLAWQLGGSDGFALVKEADANGTSPGKEVLRQLLEANAPCVVLIDELTAYVRQFTEGTTLSGGSYDSNLSFVQALTEAVKQVPTAVVLASLPESETEAGSARGSQALRALEKTFGRVQALWKPVATEEAFEIVRRRLFENVRDPQARDAVCRAFAEMYAADPAKLPTETQEARYAERLAQAYPIHPEVFDRLYEDWGTIEGFQRTRGVLKLMAKVIARLWKEGNADLLILPGSIPLADGEVRNELTYLLPTGWEPVIEKDIDGEKADTTELEGREPRFGQTQAARRVARTLFLGTAPSGAAPRPGTRGLDRGRVLLGCLQPGQSSATYSDALDRLADRLHYLNASGDKADGSTRYWFDTRANLRREMEDRKIRFDERAEVRQRIEKVLKGEFRSAGPFDGTHVFAPHGDVPDDSTLRLVVLLPEQTYAKDDPRPAFDAVLTYLEKNGNRPRHLANRLAFVAPDAAVPARLSQAVRTALAWESIVEDVKLGKLNIDQNQHRQAEKEAQATGAVLPRVARECWRWLLVPRKDEPTALKATIEAFQLNPSAVPTSKELERICRENELVIGEWSPIHLKTELQRLYWTNGETTAQAMRFWEDSLRYLYLPRLKDQTVLAAAVRSGAASRDFFGIAYGPSGGAWEGFAFGIDGKNVTFDKSLLLIEPQTAALHAAELERAAEAKRQAEEEARRRKIGGGTVVVPPPPPPPPSGGSGNGGKKVDPPHPPGPAKSFHGTVEVSPLRARSDLLTLADDVIALLTKEPNSRVRITLEISAEFPEGASESTKRSVSQNASTLKFDRQEWE